MNKLSVYEVLSFLVPGFAALFIAKQYSLLLFNYRILKNINVVEEGILYFIISLLVGLFIHIFTFYLTGISAKKKWFKLYNKLVFQSVKEIADQKKGIKKTIPFLNEKYKEIRKHNEDKSANGKIEDNLFDFAYFYLETNDKIAPSKNFQALYFMSRNLFTLFMFVSLFAVFITALSFINCESYRYKTLFILLVIFTLMTFLIYITKWLRRKFVSKILQSYYNVLTHKDDK